MYQESGDMNTYIVYTFYGLPTLTKEVAEEDDLETEFGQIPNGKVEGRDRYMTCVKLTRMNRKKFIDLEDDLPFSKTVPGFDSFSKDVQKKFRYEWSTRSW